MATIPRKRLPYLYVSWLSKYLAGERQCLWALWFQSRYKFDKVASDFDLAAWSSDHDALVAKRAEELKAAGYTVRVENENYWQLKGQTAMLAGKMDIVARKPGYAIVLDGKTGQQRKRDWWQVLIYMIALPMCWNSGNMRISGEVFYRDGTSIRIEPEEVTQEIRQKVFNLIRMLGSDCISPPAKTPSIQECGMDCNISGNDCDARIDRRDMAVTETSMF